MFFDVDGLSFPTFSDDDNYNEDDDVDDVNHD